jgi:hypothetical protein
MVTEQGSSDSCYVEVAGIVASGPTIDRTLTWYLNYAQCSYLCSVHNTPVMFFDCVIIIHLLIIRSLLYSGHSTFSS